MLHPIDCATLSTMRGSAYAEYGAGLEIAAKYDLDLTMMSDPQQTMANLVKLQSFAKHKAMEVGDNSASLYTELH